jgi:hypothetical protein
MKVEDWRRIDGSHSMLDARCPEGAREGEMGPPPPPLLTQTATRDLLNACVLVPQDAAY